MSEQDRRAGMDRWLLAHGLAGAGILLNSALYIVMVFVAAILANAPIARDLAIATAAACYFAYVAQLNSSRRPTAEEAQVLLNLFSAIVGMVAGIALLMGV